MRGRYLNERVTLNGDRRSAALSQRAMRASSVSLGRMLSKRNSLMLRKRAKRARGHCVRKKADTQVQTDSDSAINMQ